MRGKRLEDVDYFPLFPHLSKSPQISLFPNPLLGHGLPWSLGLLRLYNGTEPGDLCTGPTPPTELDLCTGGV